LDYYSGGTNESHAEAHYAGDSMPSCSGGGRAQEAAAKRNLVVRRDPSKSSPILDHVAKDDRLMLLQATADTGYNNVKTQHDVVGWVLANSVNV